MPRDFYESVMGGPNQDGLFEVFSGISVTLRHRGTTDPATVFQRETGVTQGPSPEAGATGGPNPFVTGASGSVQFWADIGRLDIFLHDTQVPARLSDRTIQWNAKPYDDIPGANILGNIPGKPTVWASGIPESDLILLLDKWLPIGIQVPYSGGSVPAGGIWDISDGGLINRTTYATFFSRAGHVYNGGVDPGSGMVRKPDKRGRGSIGAGSGTGLTGRTRGARFGTEPSNMPSHDHGGGNHAHTYVVPQTWATIDGGSFTNVANVAGTGNTGPSGTIISAQGGGADNMHPVEADYWIVRIA